MSKRSVQKNEHTEGEKYCPPQEHQLNLPQTGVPHSQGSQSSQQGTNYQQVGDLLPDTRQHADIPANIRNIRRKRRCRRRKSKRRKRKKRKRRKKRKMRRISRRRRRTMRKRRQRRRQKRSRRENRRKRYFQDPLTQSRQQKCKRKWSRGKRRTNDESKVEAQFDQHVQIQDGQPQIQDPVPQPIHPTVIPPKKRKRRKNKIRRTPDEQQAASLEPVTQPNQHAEYPANVRPDTSDAHKARISDEVIPEALEIIPLARLHHFVNGDILDCDGSNMSERITDEMAERFCEAATQFIHSTRNWWFGTTLMTRKLELSQNSTGLDRNERIISIFRRLLLCCDLSKHRNTIDDLLKSLIICLPQKYPMELLVHYLTCEDKTCNVGAAFKMNEDFIYSLQKWNKEMDFTQSDNAYNPHFHTESNNDKMIVGNIKSINKRYRELGETSEVCKRVDKFMHKLCTHIEKVTGWQGLDIKLVGSAAEESRSFYPDEFDYILIIKNQSKVQCQCEKQRDIYECYKCKKSNIHEPIYQALYTLNLESNKMPKNLYFGIGKKYMTHNYFVIYLNWLGKSFKYMPITVDIVPVLTACESFHNLPSSHYALNTENLGPKHGIIAKYIHKKKIDYCVQENMILKNLPANVRDGYVLAKAMRLYRIYENINKYETHADICKLIKTYMLKTCLLFITNNRDFPLYKSDIYWAKEIYSHLLNCVIKGKLACFFDSDEILFCIRWYSDDSYVYNKKNYAEKLIEDPYRSSNTYGSESTRGSLGKKDAPETYEETDAREYFVTSNQGSNRNPKSEINTGKTNISASAESFEGLKTVNVYTAEWSFEKIRMGLGMLAVIGRALTLLSAAYGDSNKNVVHEDFLNRVLNAISWLSHDHKLCPIEYIKEAVCEEWR